MSDALREILTEYSFALDTTALESADSIVDGLGDKLLSFGKWVAGAFAVKAVFDFTKSLVKTADHIGETSDRLGISTDELQAWQFAAKVNGIEADELTASMQRLGAGIADAAGGGGNAKAFKKLGVDLKNADGTLKNSAQVFEEAGLAIGALENPTEQAGLAADLFGKQYARLLPLFKEGPAGIARLREEFKNFGGGFDAEFIKNAQKFGDQLDILGLAGQALAGEAMAPLVPLLIDLAGLSLDFVRALAGTSKERTSLAVLGRAIGNIVRAFTQGKASTGVFNAGLRLGGKLARILLEPLLRIEDFLVFLAGGESVLGDWVEETFGKGTSDKVRGAFGEIFKGIDGVKFSMRELILMFLALGFTSIRVADLIKNALLSVPIAIEQAFEDMWNGILDGAADAVQKLGEAVGRLPGGAGKGADLTTAAEGIRSQKTHVGAAAAANVQADQALKQAQMAAFARQVLDRFGPGKDGTGPSAPAPGGAPASPAAASAAAAAAQAQAMSVLKLAEAIAAQSPKASGPVAAAAVAAPPPQWLIDGIKVENKTYVTVPAGTDAETAQGVADAANTGSKKGVDNLTATLAAVTSG